MKGSIFLVENNQSRIVPAFCLQVNGSKLLMAQIRSASVEEILISKEQNKQRENRKKIKKRHQVNQKSSIVYIGKPDGLKSESVVMLNKRMDVVPSKTIRKIGMVSEDLSTQCILLSEKSDKHSRLHLELRNLKKKIQLAQFNNEMYNHLQKRVYEITTELGYSISSSPKHEKQYMNFRQVPTEGRIKVYHGGR